MSVLFMSKCIVSTYVSVKNLITLRKLKLTEACMLCLYGKATEHVTMRKLLTNLYAWIILLCRQTYALCVNITKAGSGTPSPHLTSLLINSSLNITYIEYAWWILITWESATVTITNLFNTSISEALVAYRQKCTTTIRI